MGPLGGTCLEEVMTVGLQELQVSLGRVSLKMKLMCWLCDCVSKEDYLQESVTKLSKSLGEQREGVSNLLMKHKLSLL